VLWLCWRAAPVLPARSGRSVVDWRLMVGGGLLCVEPWTVENGWAVGTNDAKLVAEH